MSHKQSRKIKHGFTKENFHHMRDFVAGGGKKMGNVEKKEIDFI